MLGERILFKRIDGKVYAIEDRCLHRGVPLSVRPECYTKNTISCWYHGFTYDLRDGKLVAIITDPESPLIGRNKLKSYPVEEHKNLVFVFVGDAAPHPIALDLQPGFLDDGLAIYPGGEHEIVKSNWRLAAENGVDASHIYIHRNSALINAARRPLPLSTYFLTREGMVVDQDGAPKGVVKGVGRRTAGMGNRDRGGEDRKPIPARRQHRSTQRHRHIACGFPAASRSTRSRGPAPSNTNGTCLRMSSRTTTWSPGVSGWKTSSNASSSSARWT